MAYGQSGPDGRRAAPTAHHVPRRDPAVTDIRLDPREGVLRYREGSQAGVVHTLSLHGLIGTGWRNRARTDAAFDAYGQPAEPAVRPAVRAVAADGTVHTAVSTRDGILVTRQGAHPVSHVVGRRSEDPPRSTRPGVRS